MEFDQVKAVVTGGASGIGAAVVAELKSRGARVAVLDLDPGAGALSFSCDVAEDQQVRSAVAAAAKALDGIDVLVNNVGVGAQGAVDGNDDQEWHRAWDINVLGMVRVTRATLPYLRASDHAAIVNVCSVVATIGLPERVLYSATKGAVLSASLAMAADLLHEGIRVNCVSPGTTDTPWIGRLLDQATDPVAERAALEARQPTGRLVTPEEVALAVTHLCHPRAGSTTGVNMIVDGGLASLRPRPRPST
jgi:NAD(P)-dependent dehydrogenase (short-subunit alcohol dehydrogenase family)